jgi:NAD(P)-dependent dehydrogenase (short-subunit alcohol dehydrogenase family)
MKHQIAQMLEQKSGAIVNVASAGIRSIKGNSPAYVTSKSAVVGLTRAAALSYAGKNIRINSLSPGATRTPMLESFADDQITALGKSIPIGRCGEPDEMATAALWLFSDEARYANGSDLLIDGGWALS